MAKNQKGRKMKTENRTPCFCRQSYRILRIDRMQSSVLFVVHLLDGNSPGSDSTKTNGLLVRGDDNTGHLTLQGTTTTEGIMVDFSLPLDTAPVSLGEVTGVGDLAA